MIGYIRGLAARRPWLICSSVVTLIFLISNHLLVRGRAAPIWDAYAYFYHYYVLLSDAARAGHFLYWNPLSGGGEPITADPMIGTFSPVNSLISLLDGGTTAGFVFYWLFVWWLGGAGVLLLARHLKAPAWGGAVVALGFLFCGIYTGNAEHTPWLTSFSFLPLIIWRLDAALCARKVWPAFEAGALWGLSALAGYPGFTIVTGMYACMWALGRWLSAARPDEDVKELRRAQIRAERRRLSLPFVFVLLATTFLIGVIVMSPSYFSFLYEGAGFNLRSSALTREAAVTLGALHPGALSTFASPYLMLLKLRQMESPWPYPDVSMSNVYAGVVVTVLAVLALACRPRSLWRWWLALMAVLSIACALGRALPVRGWLYDYIYPTRFFQHTPLFRAYYIFTLSVLALLATKQLASSEALQGAHLWKLFRSVALILAALACAAILLAHIYMPPGSRGFDRTEYLHLIIIWGGICCAAFVASAHLSNVRRYIPFVLLLIAGADALTTGFVSRPTMVFTNENVVAEWKSFDKQHNPRLYPVLNTLARDYQWCDWNELCFNNYHLVTKRSVLRAYSLSSAYNSFFLVTSQDPLLRGMATGEERIWFSTTAEAVSPTTGNMNALKSRANELGAAPLLISSRDEMLQSTVLNSSRTERADQAARIMALPGLERIPVKLIRYEPEALALDVYAPSDGWLLVTERWSRSWQATVNGQPTPLVCGNFLFRAVRVTAGSNRVEFTYKPFYLPALLIISWSALAFVAAGAIYFRRRQLRTPARESA